MNLDNWKPMTAREDTLINAVRTLRDELEQAQTELAESERQTRAQLKRIANRDNRIEQLEAALKGARDEIADVDGTMKAWLIIGEALEPTD